MLAYSAAQLVRGLGAVSLRPWGVALRRLLHSEDGVPLVGGAQQPEQPPAVQREPETPLLHSIRNRIMEVLTNPGAGFYMHRDVFGAGGDFTTSPEISQMFGEMMGIWCLVTWMHLGQPPALNLVELGPGRGTLMADLLRGTSGFEAFSSALRVHLVELSPALRQQQYKALRCHTPTAQHSDGAAAAATSPSHTTSTIGSASSTVAANSSVTPPAADASSSGSSSTDVEGSGSRLQGADVETAVCGLNACQVTWHSSLGSVPEDAPTLYLGHEFVDALPVHQFVRDPRGRGWVEVMVDVVGEGDPGPHHLRFVLSPGPTPAASLLVPRRLAALSPEQQEATTAIEISAFGMALAERLALRVARHGGAALLIDYGANHPYPSSLNAIRQHQGVSALSQPGTADLSAWVDFAALRLAAEGAEQAAAEQQQQGGQAEGGVGSRKRRRGYSGAAVDVGSATHPDQQQQQEQEKVVQQSDTAPQQQQQQQQPGGGVHVWGPVSQSHLLHSLGIQARLQALAEGASPSQVDALVAGYERLTGGGPQGMGVTYQALAITSSNLPPPVGFEQQQGEQDRQGQGQGEQQSQPDP